MYLFDTAMSPLSSLQYTPPYLKICVFGETSAPEAAFPPFPYLSTGKRQSVLSEWNGRQPETGRRLSLRWEVGDTDVHESSAVLSGSEINPVQQNHGSLYVDNDVKMRLQVELTR